MAKQRRQVSDRPRTALNLPSQAIHLNLRLTQLEVGRQKIVSKGFAEASNAALELFIERLEVVPVEFETTDQLESTGLRIVRRISFFDQSIGLGWYQKWYNKGTFASFNYHHSFDGIRISGLSCKRTAISLHPVEVSSSTT